MPTPPTRSMATRERRPTLEDRVAISTEQRRVVEGSADGGKGRDEASPPDMNALLRGQTARSKGTITVDA